MDASYDGRQVVGIDLHRRRSVIVRMTGDGIPSRVRRTASVPIVIFPVSSARIRRATSRMISAPTGSSAT